MPAAVTPNSQTIVADVDGDGLNELIIFDNTLQQLSVVHQFQYFDPNYFTLSAISSSVWPATNPENDIPLWTQDPDTHWWTLWSASNGQIQASTGSSNWGIQAGDTIIAADFDGDGSDELFIYNLNSLNWGILKWYTNPDTNASEMQMIYSVSVAQAPSSPTQNQLTWQASAADQYFVIPKISGLITTLPAKASGLWLYNSQNTSLGMISYSSSPQEFQQWFTFPGGTLSGWQLQQNNPPSNQFFPGMFASATAPSIAVYDPQDQYIGLFQWNGTNNFTMGPAQGGSVGHWNLQSGDQIQVADLNGDGIDEIFIYSPQSKDIAVFEWKTSEFQSYAITPGTIGTAPTDWSIGNSDKYYCVNSPSGTRIFAFGSNPTSSSPWVAVLEYESGSAAFSCQWASSSLLANNGWPVTGSDSFYAGPSSSSATATLFTTSTQNTESSSAFTLGAIDWSGDSLEISSSAQMPVPAWSVGFLASAPHTDFAPFVDGDQPAIYTYISHLFPMPGQKSSGKPIRDLYTHTEDSGDFYPFAMKINGVTLEHIPSYWPKPGAAWSEHDWHEVVKTIVAECNQVSTVYALFASMATLIGDLNTFQKADLGTVSTNIQSLSQPSQTPEWEYWAGQITVGVLWGLAAAGTAFFPGAEAAAVAWGVSMSTFASLAGSIAGYNPTQKQSYPAIQNMQNALTNTLVASIVTQSKELTAILKDPVKLKIANGLHESEWEIDTSLPSKAQLPFSNMDRLSMYQNLIPYYFHIYVANYPNRPAPGYALLILSNLYYSMNGQGGISESSFTGSPLYPDLFTTLKVSVDDFLLGNGPWAMIPRTTNT